MNNRRKLHDVLDDGNYFYYLRMEINSFGKINIQDIVFETIKLQTDKGITGHGRAYTDVYLFARVFHCQNTAEYFTVGYTSLNRKVKPDLWTPLYYNEND